MLKYWIWLCLCKGIGPRMALCVLNYFGTPDRAYYADDAEYALVPDLTKAQIKGLQNKDLKEAEKILDNCAKLGIHILTYQDAAYPERLRNIPDPPIVLYYKGSIPNVDDTPTIAMVGARKATPYGLLHAKRFGYQLSAGGAIVVSGMARGIDTLSLEGALTAGTPVIGVLGCGIDRIYPPENGALYQDVIAHGWLISEYPPGTPPDARNFPVRNRIMSGLSTGVLVVEAGARSGSLITASRALEQGRDVFAIPSNIGVEVGEGNNRLLREGAILVTSGQDILQEYIHQFPDRIHMRTGGDNLTLLPRDLQRAEEKTLPNVAQKIDHPQAGDKKSVDKNLNRSYIDLEAKKDELSHDEWALASQLSAHPIHVDELIEASGLSAAQALSALTLLELKGIAVRMPGRRYELALKK